MKIVVAPDKFKGCLSAADVAAAIAQGLGRAEKEVEIDLCPMADGGEGTVQALVAATGGRIISQKVCGPLPRMTVDAPIGLLGDERTAVIEMASASGLYLLSEQQRDPTRTTTYGTGELLRAAADLGAKRIILGIGGSATVDGGVGCAQAWGAKFTLISGQTYTAYDRRLSGADLPRLLRIEGSLPKPANHPLLEFKPTGGAAPLPRAADRAPVRLDTAGIEFVVACDVGNPLLGPDGAAAIFGPQKGATPEKVELLEHGLRTLVERTGCSQEAATPGAGAAGGLGFGMLVFFGATLRPGIEIVIDAVKLRHRLADADLCITGEGKLDAQSLSGKTVYGVARLCREMGVPCIALAGSIEDGAAPLLGQGLSACFSIAPGPISFEQAMKRASELISSRAESILRCHLARPERTIWDALAE